MIRYFNIPIFIPELACPFQCIFCDQRKITGQKHIVNKEDIIGTIEEHLSTIPNENTEVLIAFFGGTFTGLSLDNQKQYLELAKPYILSKQISGIRISTRPDYINEDILKLLKEYHVTHIELGAQSLIDKVLKESHRGHTYNDVRKASKLIRENGFTLGLQMMLGLPSDTKEYSKLTAQRIIELGAQETRIYPTLVIKGTALDLLLQKGKYMAMSTQDAVEQSAELYMLFSKNNVKVLRIGLYPDEGLLNDEFVAGPDMHNFKEKVMTFVWGKKLLKLLIQENKDKRIIIYVNKKQLNFASGFKATNKIMLLQTYRNVKFKVAEELKDFEFNVDYS